MSKTLVLRNLGSSSIVVNDLGLFIAATSSLNIESFVSANRFAVHASQDLRSLLAAETLVLNDGASDIAVGDVTAYLDRFCVLDHQLTDDHIGDLPESRIADGNILARIGSNEVITGKWEFPGGIKLQADTALPTTVGDEGTIFYKTSDPSALYVSNGTAWIELVDASRFDPSTGHEHDGSDSAQVSHDNLVNITPDQHHNQKHSLDSSDDHIGTLSESKIADGAILARVAANETITGTYNFASGGIIVQTGATLPTGTIATGRLFWRDTGVAATRSLFVGDGNSWVEFIKSSIFSAHNHDGVNSPNVDHANLLNKGTNSHTVIDSHLAKTSDPHGSIMTVSGRVNTPEVRGTGGDLVFDAADAANTTIFLKNSGGGGLTVRVVGQLDVDGAVNHNGTEDLLVADNKIILNSNYVGASPNTNASIEVMRDTAGNAKLLWDESIDEWQAGIDATLYTFAFSDRAETVTGDWAFQGGLRVPFGANLPATASEAGIFWKTGTTDKLFVGDGVAWQEILLQSIFSAHTHNGTDAPVVAHSNLSGVTENQHHNKLHSYDDVSHHSGQLSESNIADGSILARVASDESITGNWSFAAGSLVIPSGASLPATGFTDGRLFWKSDTDTLYAADGAAWQAIAKKNGILSLSAGLALTNSGTTQTPKLDVGVDNTTIEINGASAGAGGSLRVKAIAESLITDGSILARLASNETITGNWEFNGNLIIPTIAGSTPPASAPIGSVVQLEGNKDLYIGTGTATVKVITETNLAESLKFAHTFSTRANGVPAGTFLSIGEVVSGFDLGVVIVSACKLAGAALIVQNASNITDGSGIEIFVNGTSVATLATPNGAKKANRNDLSVALNAGDYVSVRCMTTNGTSLRNPIANIYFK